MKVLNATLAGLRWAWGCVLRAYYWLEEKHYDPPVMSFTRILVATVGTLAVGVVMGYVLFHRDPVIIEKRVEIPVYRALAATPLPCVPAPAVEEPKPAKKAVRKAKRAKAKPAPADHDWLGL